MPSFEILRGMPNKIAFSAGKPFVVNAFRLGSATRNRYQRSGPVYFSDPVVNPLKPPNGQSCAYRIRVIPRPVAK